MSGTTRGAGSGNDIMRHIGWCIEESLNHYTKLPQLVDGNVTAAFLQSDSGRGNVAHIKCLSIYSVGNGRLETAFK